MNTAFNKSKAALIAGFCLTFTSCDWTPSAEATFASFPANGEIFIDGFSGGLEYLPFGGSKLDAFTVDENEFYEGTASMRFDVPNGDNVDGNFAGAIFPDFGGRNLSEFDALTFWAKASKTTTIDALGFGNNFGENTYLVTKSNLKLSTAWQQYTIPIPDASKLTREQGLFWYSTGAKPLGLDGEGYTFWIDELQFEKLGTVAQPQPAILGGVDEVEQSFTGASLSIDGFTQTFNLASGFNETVTAAPSYFDFTTSDATVVLTDDLGVLTVIGAGSAQITASLAGVEATGSLTVNSSGAVDPAPTPAQAAANVISIFSDSYDDVPVDFFNGFYGGSTTQTADIAFGSDNVKFYTDLNFVGIEMNNPPVDASEMNFLHLDIWTNSSPSANFDIKIRDRGSNGVLNTDIFTGGPLEDDREITFTVTPGSIPNSTWLGIDIPLTGDIATQKNNIAQIVFVGDMNFLLDNLYFYQ